MHRPERVEVIEHIGVLVKGRAVANLNEVVHGQRAGGQCRQPCAVALGQGVVGPADGAAGDGVEALGAFDARPDLVVIAANQRVRLQRPNPVADRIGVGAVADQVAQHEDLCVTERRGRGHDGLIGLEIRVDVADDQVAH